MKVKDLIAELLKMDPERECIMQKDAEGNGYSPLYGVDDNARYIAATTWYGDVKRETLSEEDRRRGFGEDDVTTDGAPAVVLCPVN